MNKKFFILWMLLGMALMTPTLLWAQVAIERSTEVVTISGKQYYMHHVKRGETLYSLAKVYEVSEAEIKKLNPEIDELGLQADMVIGIPLVTKTEEVQPSGDGYTVYTVEEAERTKRLIRRLDVDPDRFYKLNPTVGSRVFVGQKVLLPVEAPLPQSPSTPETPHTPDTVVVRPVVNEIDTIVVEPRPSGAFVLPTERPDTCQASPQNAYRHYRVALMVPLYLDDVDRVDASKEKAEKTKNSRSMRFLQFYEGFMMAADSLARTGGLHLDLQVIDVHENVSTARAALSQIRGEQVDLIIGPFFSKSFAVVEEYALSQHITIVNPMSERENIIVDAPNVVKLKPNEKSMAAQLADLVKTHYPKAKVALITEGDADDIDMVMAIEQALDTTVAREVLMSNEEMLDLIANESRRRNMGKRQLSTLEVEGQIFSTRSLQENLEGTVYFDNPFRTYSFNEVEELKRNLSLGRNNVIIAYGKDIVFATKILNTINKSTQNYPITLIGLPTWSDFDNLLVPNLLNMNAIYFDDHFVDFNDSLVLRFVDDFRSKYQSEPSDYAFEGFDVGWYFLNALLRYGPHAQGCLPYEHLPLMHTRYFFTKKRYEDGLENRYWSVYQYDSQSVELKPVMVYPEEEE